MTSSSSSPLENPSQKAQVFIDGQAGTTGLEITERLAAREDIHLITLSDTERKDINARRDALLAADVAVLCLPDEAAREAVALVQQSKRTNTRIIDASTAFRTDPAWVYGLPELGIEEGTSNRARIAAAEYVSNPGCYPQGFILSIRPLIEAGIISEKTALRCHAVSGYSGGGRQMIEQHRGFDANQADTLNSQAYALDLAHKHVPEMQRYSTSQVRPLFSPMVAHYYKGMLVQIPLFAHEVGHTSLEQINGVLSERYADEPFVDVWPTQTSFGFLNPTATNGTNTIEIMTCGQDEQINLISRYDNLGKGAAGAAVQNLNIMLGCSEGAGLSSTT